MIRSTMATISTYNNENFKHRVRDKHKQLVFFRAVKCKNKRTS